MKRLISPGRLAFLGLLTAALVILYVCTLYKLQIVDGTEYYEASTNSIVTTETVIAARGNILDRYGRLLVSNRNCNNLLIDADELSAMENSLRNETILKMCAIVTENGDTYSDDLPITTTSPFEFTDMDINQRLLLEAWLDANGLDSDATAVEVMAQMRTRYGIDNNYSAEEMRIIAGVRYSVNVRYVINTSDYIYAEDVSIDTITALMEADIPCFEVQVSYIREYNTEYAAHILGYTGPIYSADEYELYKEKGYPLNAVVGKSGAELAFEEYLHGSDGEAQVTRTSDGVVTNTVYTKAPDPGNHIYLTIDIELQAVAESALASFIQETNAYREENNITRVLNGKEAQEMITGGAVVAIDVDTGEPLCIANYPTYNLETFTEDYSKLLADEETYPLMNRCLDGLYYPGSTFKPITALAALNENKINEATELTCEGVYLEYADSGYTPRCTGIHGNLVLTEAITASCNLFFFQVGDELGIRLIEDYAHAFGLGQKTGIELGEYTGRIASPEWKEILFTGADANWHAGDTVQAAIGQSDTMVTPIQLARYCAALANFGDVYECSMLKSVSSYDYSQSVYERVPRLANEIDASDYLWGLVREGMIGSANSPMGTSFATFYGYTPTVAAKTGTTETGAVSDDAVFICYAPANDPEIAIAVVVEKGVAGANLAPIARSVLDYYFDFEQSTQQVEAELTLLH